MRALKVKQALKVSRFEADRSAQSGRPFPEPLEEFAHSPFCSVVSIGSVASLQKPKLVGNAAKTKSMARVFPGTQAGRMLPNMALALLAGK
jgi:hypothetical protein